MRIDPQEVDNTPYSNLTLVQKNARKVAIVVAFVGVFIWFIKIVF